MKVILLVSWDYFSSYGGAQIYVKNIALCLARLGVELNIVSITAAGKNSAPDIKKIQINDICVFQISLASDRSNHQIPLELSEEFCLTLEKIVQVIEPDLIHAHGWKAAAALVAHRLGIACVITAHHGGIVCPNGLLMNDDEDNCNLPASEKNCLSCALSFVPGGGLWRPLVHLMTSTSRLSLAKKLRGLRNIPYVSPAFQVPLGIAHKQAQIAAMRQAQCFIAPSRAIADALLVNGFSGDRVKVIPHGVPPLLKQPIQPGYPGRPLRLGYVGRVNYIKGLHVTLAALQRLPKPLAVEFHVYGEAVTKAEKTYSRRLQAISQHLKVTWHGKIAHEHIGKAYQDIDVLLLSSICTEIFGLTLLEALSVGRPVIATQCGGPKDIITDGEDGFLVPTNDADALANTIQRFIDQPDLLHRMASQIKPINTLQDHVTDLLAVYAAARAPTQIGTAI